MEWVGREIQVKGKRRDDVLPPLQGQDSPAKKMVLRGSCGF